MLFFQLDARFSNLCLQHEIASSRKRRVDINQIHLSGELLQQRAHDEQVVAPDQLVAPTIGEGVAFLAGVEVKERGGGDVLGLAGGAAFVARLSLTRSMTWKGRLTRGTSRSEPFSLYFPGQTSSVLVMSMFAMEVFQADSLNSKRRLRLLNWLKPMSLSCCRRPTTMPGATPISAAKRRMAAMLKAPVAVKAA